ncbi:hypothetical protein A3C87_01285 [Candidatus Kaiserbacteria bacterium RIFCSPHIGHO2_02_FULL_49_34]|uniref:HTH marR-type domain-containing protein n=1 Tax=Candidatus Kaiserbacteria bacterium RIFCSPHIGHO2_02_FULL_49_34 TaxID=1798491 RepID=A0A1F6DLD6_9BACT|nr:MAG: hypothetical protein A3C87_01285 [Candidatus Kaiserbacteria bacterium RIFCSPHIGHO2_02_FULL_49_34]
MESKFSLSYPDTLLRAAVFIDAEANTILRAAGITITFTQYRILRHIASGTTMPTVLAHLLAVSHPAMSRHLKNLEASKLIKSSIHTDSRREHHITLTLKGTKLCKDAEQTLAKGLKITLADISPSARTSVLTTLEKTIIACAHVAE